MPGMKISGLPAATTLDSADVLAGVNGGDTKKFSLSTILAWIKSTLTKADVGLGNVANVLQYSAENKPTPDDIGAIPATDKGAADGVASLDSSGHVPSTQLDLDDAPEPAGGNAISSGGVYDALLDLYPHAEVSGPVAAFDDGADGLPVRSCVITMLPIQAGSGDPAPTNIRQISGRSSIALYHYDGDGDYQTEDAFAIIRHPAPVTGAAGSTATFSIIVRGDDATYQWQYKNTANWVNASSAGYNTPSISYEITAARCNNLYRCVVTKGGTTLYSAPCFMDIPGNTPTRQEPGYVPDYAPESSLSLGATIYGGEVSVDDGKLVNSWKYLELDGSESWTESPVTQPDGYVRYQCYIDVTGGKAVGLPYAVCSHFATASEQNTPGFWTYSDSTTSANTLAIRFSVLRADYPTVDAFKEYLAAQDAASTPVAIAWEVISPTETSITGAEVNTLLGGNSFWSDGGDVDVDYRADPSLFVTTKINAVMAAIAEL